MAGKVGAGETANKAWIAERRGNVLVFNYREADRRAVISWDAADQATPWLGIVRDMMLQASKEARGEGAFSVSLPWWNFLAQRPQILDLVRGFRLKSGADFVISDAASALLSAAHRRAEGYGRALETTRLGEDELRARLSAAGFVRSLTAQQMRNVRLLAALPAGATFSVPGAGKTTEALPRLDGRYPTVVYRPRRVAQIVPWQLVLLINGIRLTRRVKKVWAREMKETKQEMRWLQRQLLKALARRMGKFAPPAGKRRILPGRARIRGATARDFDSVCP